MAKIGMNFGKEADNLLRQGAGNSMSVMSLGGAAIGGAYEGTIGDGDIVGGAIQGGALGAASKFASNMYSIGARRSGSSDFKFSHFTDGWNFTGERGKRIGLGMSELRNGIPNTPSAQSRNMNSAVANTTNPVGPSPQANTATQVNMLPKGTDLAAHQRRKVDTLNNRGPDVMAQERMAAAQERQRKVAGSNVSEDAKQRLNLSRTGTTSTSLGGSGDIGRELAGDIIGSVFKETGRGHIQNPHVEGSLVHPRIYLNRAKDNFKPSYKNGEYLHPQHAKVKRYQSD